MTVVIFIILFFLILVIPSVFILLTLFKIMSIFLTDAPFIPTSNKVVDDVINNLQLTENSILYDLGCGDARILKRVSELKPHIKIVGIEIAPVPYLLAKFFTKRHGNIEIRRENIFKANISDATHIYLYLYPKVVNELINDIKKQCAPGTLIISCDFKIKSYTPTKVVNLDNKHSKLCRKLFVYIL